MFWKRKENVSHGKLGPLLIPPIPAKKEFNNMFEILREAEGFDSIEEYALAEEHLQLLKRYIDSYGKP